MNAPSSTAQAASEFDVCILGAGAAGLVLAELLSREAPLRVCLIESGPLHFKDRVEPFRVHSVVREHLGVNEGRVTAFGGATNTWGGGLIRLSPADFQALDGRPDTKWPIAFDSLIPHYQAIEQLFGFQAAHEGPQSILFRESDLVVRRRDIPVLPFRSKNFAHRFGPGLQRRNNVHILCNTEVHSILPSADAARIDAIQVRTNGSEPRLIRARSFVLSAGIVNTNLLAARFFSACGQSSRASACGRHFHDHVSFPIARLHPRSQTKFSLQFGYRFERGLMLGEHFDIETHPARLPGGFLHLAFDTSESQVLRPVRDVLNIIQRRTLKGQRLPSLREVAAMVIGVPRLGIMRYGFRRLFLDSGTKVLATLDLEQIPQEQWVIGSDPATRQCNVAWDLSDDDVHLAARYVPICLRILDTLRKAADFDLEMLIPDPQTDRQAFANHIKKASVDTLHSSGGLRMGDSPSALVDSDLRLAGIANVHALSAAVFPRVGTSNPTLTILALGHRLATQLISQAPAARA